MGEIKEDSQWIYCPVCGGKMRTKVCKETVLENARSTVQSVKWKSKLMLYN